MCHRPVALQTSSVAGTATTIVSLCTSMPTNRVDCYMDPSPVPEAPRQTIRRAPRSSTHRDDGSPLQAGYGHEVFRGGFAPHKPLIRLARLFSDNASKGLTTS